MVPGKITDYAAGMPAPCNITGAYYDWNNRLGSTTAIITRTSANQEINLKKMNKT